VLLDAIQPFAGEGGKELWRQHVESAVVTAPFVGGERVFVLGVDRSVIAFDAIDGHRLWTYARPGEQGPRARCWLKTAVPPARPAACCISGAK